MIGATITTVTDFVPLLQHLQRMWDSSDTVEAIIHHLHKIDSHVNHDYSATTWARPRVKRAAELVDVLHSLFVHGALVPASLVARMLGEVVHAASSSASAGHDGSGVGDTALKNVSPVVLDLFLRQDCGLDGQPGVVAALLRLQWYDVLTAALHAAADRRTGAGTRTHSGARIVADSARTIDFPNRFGETPLLLAARGGVAPHDVVAALIRAGADPFKCSGRRECALDYLLKAPLCHAPKVAAALKSVLGFDAPGASSARIELGLAADAAIDVRSGGAAATTTESEVVSEPVMPDYKPVPLAMSMSFEPRVAVAKWDAMCAQLDRTRLENGAVVEDWLGSQELCRPMTPRDDHAALRNLVVGTLAAAPARTTTAHERVRMAALTRRALERAGSRGYSLHAPGPLAGDDGRLEREGSPANRELHVRLRDDRAPARADRHGDHRDAVAAVPQRLSDSGDLQVSQHHANVEDDGNMSDFGEDDDIGELLP